MHRFRFHPADVSDDNVVILSKEESRHALKVLRLKPGDAVELLDGKDKKFRGVVVGEEKGLVEVSVDQNPVAEGRPPAAEITLAASVIKPERMELLIQKAAEIGAARIVPVVAERCVVRLSRERWAGKVERWKKIALEACKQSGRARVPEIASPVDFKTFVRSVGPEDLFLFPTLAVPGKSLRDLVGNGHARSLRGQGGSRSANMSPPDGVRWGHITIAVGPEGDFTKEEARLALEHQAVPVSLGDVVLRSETAALYLLSIVYFWFNES